MRWIATSLVFVACTGADPDPTTPTDGPCTPDEWYVDADRDGFGAGDLVEGCAEDRPLSSSDLDTDCDDDNRDVSPDGVEACNGIDDDCDGGIDDADPDDDPTGTTLFFVDGDGDGFGDPQATVRACAVSDGIVDDQSDCDDGNEEVFPGAEEVCNGIDDDCNQTVDDDATDALTFYRDTDGDSFGDANATVVACTQPTNTVEDATDCDDSDDAIFPGAPERCNAIDDDCDTFADDTDPDSVPVDGQTFWADLDGDTFGDDLSPVTACVQPAMTATRVGDCDDTDDTVRPGAVEDCSDTVDRNCDGSLPTEDLDNDQAPSCEDCDDSDPNILAPLDWYLDGDMDGFGDGAPVVACVAPIDHVALDGDCDDLDDQISPAADEVCDGLDNDCDALLDEDDPDAVDVIVGYTDDDRDGYGANGSGTNYCALPPDVATGDGDCDDTDDTLNPETEWWTDGDMDGFGDASSVTMSCEAPPGTVRNPDDCDDTDDNVLDGELFYRDADGDGFGTDTIAPIQACSAPTGRVADNTDCDDLDPVINPDTLWYADGDMDGFGDTTMATMSCLQPPDTVLVPDDCDDTDPSVGGPASWYADTDMDGYGDPNVVVAVSCTQPATGVANDEDCDDTDMMINPLTPWYEDVDGDGFGDPTSILNQCLQPTGYVDNDQDCDDGNALVEPGRFDFGDGIDNDCDTLVDEDVGNETTTAADVQLVVNARCASCHTTGSSGGMTMGTNNVWAATVNVPSTQASGMDRIEPGDPDNSYIWRKIEGTQAAAGGSGSQMPFGGSLNSADRDVWETWILEGAVP